eukprot:3293360-Amphidinium_carterae.1
MCNSYIASVSSAALDSLSLSSLPCPCLVGAVGCLLADDDPDGLGHVDGMVMFLDSSTVCVNSYPEPLYSQAPAGMTSKLPAQISGRFPAEIWCLQF